MGMSAGPSMHGGREGWGWVQPRLEGPVHSGCGTLPEGTPRSTLQFATITLHFLPIPLVLPPLVEAKLAPEKQRRPFCWPLPDHRDYFSPPPPEPFPRPKSLPRLHVRGLGFPMGAEGPKNGERYQGHPPGWSKAASLPSPQTQGQSFTDG